MTYPKHTPGPWTGHTHHGSAFGLIEGRWWRCNHERQQVIATVEPDFTEETVANIRLIAAAPDLLAALQHLTEVCVRHPDGSLTLGCEDVAHLERVIARATA